MGKFSSDLQHGGSDPVRITSFPLVGRGLLNISITQMPGTSTLPPHFLVHVEQQKSYFFLSVSLESIVSSQTASLYQSISNNRIEFDAGGGISGL